jgi:hypothetical protein
LLLKAVSEKCMQLPPVDDSERVWFLGDTGGDPRTMYAAALLLPPLLLLLHSLLAASRLLALQLMRSLGPALKIPASAAMASAGVCNAEQCGVQGRLRDVHRHISLVSCQINHAGATAQLPHCGSGNT